jgi:lysophospholipase L1-like esterase
MRVGLYAKTRDINFLLYGFAQKRQQEIHEKFYDDEGNVLYHKCKPSDDVINPINKWGFRGPEISPEKEGVIRVVCLGSSTTYGLGLPYSGTYPKLLQDRLDRISGTTRYEVINAGVSAYQLKHIMALYEREIASLRPDVVILMNVFNNLITDDRDFFFIRVEGDESSMLARLARNVLKQFKKYSLLVSSVDNLVQKGYKNFLQDIHWQKGAEAIMRSEGLWETMAHDLDQLFKLIIRNNPAVRIIVLDEPMNTLDYPELAGPMDKAYKTQRDVCSLYENVYHVELSPIFNNAQKESKKIWIAPHNDPIHLSFIGNQLLVSVVMDVLEP